MASIKPRLLSSLTVLLALAGAAAQAAPGVVWVENDSFALTACAGSDESPAPEDPQTLMRLLRARGLADAAVKLNGKAGSRATLTPISATWRCDGEPSTVVFRLSTIERSGSVSTSHLVSRVPAAGTSLASNR